MSNNNNSSDKNAPDPGVSKNAEQRPKSSGPSGKTIALILGIVAIICVSFVAYMLLSANSQPAAVADEDELPAITQENVTEIEASIQESVAQGMFQTFMNTHWVFPDGESPSSNARMGNASGNNYDFYFTLAVDGEIVLTSGLLPVGTEMEEIVLDTALPAGDYNAVMTVNMLDEEGEPIDANMGFNITLSVLE